MLIHHHPAWQRPQTTRSIELGTGGESPEKEEGEMVRRGLEGGWKWEVEAEQVHLYTEAKSSD